MSEHDEPFTPEKINEQTRRISSASQAEADSNQRLFHDLSRALRDHEAEENARSLQRSWERILSAQQVGQHTLTTLTERKVIPLSTSTNGTGKISSRHQQTIRRRAGIFAAVAVALILIGSIAFVTQMSKNAHTITSNQPNTATGAQNQQQQKVISSGKRVCSLNAGSKVSINGAPWSAGLNWSAQGQLVVGTYSSFKAYSTKNCSPIASFQPAIQQQPVGPLWSPDGSKLLVANPQDPNSTYVLDRNGKILTKLKGNFIGSASWSSDSTKIIFSQGNGSQSPNPVPFSSQLMKIRVSLKAVDVNHGNKVTTLTQLPEGYSIVGWSSDAKTVVVRSMKNDRNTMDLATWDTDKGKLVSNTSLPEPALGQQLSPDGSMLALDSEDKIEIYSTDTWKLLASFDDKKGPNTGASLAWSPNGNYLAEVSQSIKIYDVTAKKLATTFGQVDAHHTITDLAWSPDGTGLATSTMVLSDDQPSNLTVNVWALS